MCTYSNAAWKDMKDVSAAMPLAYSRMLLLRFSRFCLAGTPQYLLQINDRLSIEENIKNTFLNPISFLYEEPVNLLKQEVREPAIYTAIPKILLTYLFKHLAHVVIELRCNALIDQIGSSTGDQGIIFQHKAMPEAEHIILDSRKPAAISTTSKARTRRWPTGSSEGHHNTCCKSTTV